MKIKVISNPKGEAPWTDSFIQLALRAIRKVHHDYLPWSLSQDLKQDLERTAQDARADALARLNTGEGIELADEQYVCAAIQQELIASRLSFAWYVEKENDEPLTKCYRIEREVKVGDGSGRRIDMVSRRVDISSPERTYCKSLIEAKRGRRRTPRYDGKPVRPSKEDDYLTKDVAKDVVKLLDVRREFLVTEVDQEVEPNLYLLIWDTVTKDNNEELSPYKFLEEVCKEFPNYVTGKMEEIEKLIKELNASSEKQKKKQRLEKLSQRKSFLESVSKEEVKIELNMRQVLWLPLVWNSPKRQESLEHLEFRQALWLAQVEVNII